VHYEHPTRDPTLVHQPLFFTQGMPRSERDQQDFGLGEPAVDGPLARKPWPLRIDKFGAKSSRGLVERDADVSKIEECVV
jgi:hypothetical protein